MISSSISWIILLLSFTQFEPSVAKYAKLIGQGHYFEQSSTYGKHVAELGNDEDRNTFFHTNKKAFNYWRVDLVYIYKIHRIYLYARQDGYGKRLDRVRIKVGYDLNTLKECAFYVGPAHTRAELGIECSGIGRHVHLTQEVNEYFHLAEVTIMAEEYGDELWLSRNKFVSTSSEYNSNYKAANGIDENWNTMFHTLLSPKNYFIIDLGKVYKITRVYIVNRKDGSGERLRDLSITAGEDLFYLKECAYYQGPSYTGDERDFPCDTVARFVMLTQNAYDYFHLNEVQVFGFLHNEFKIVSQGRSSVQSSTYSSAYAASNGNDGNVNTIFHTLKALNNYWRVDLGQVHLIDRVHIINRKDSNGERLAYLSVSIGADVNTLVECGTYTGPSKTGDEFDIRCKGLGRYVNVKQIVNAYFHLAEVQVFGKLP